MKGARLKDLTGLRFGRLLVVERGENVRKHAAWKCLCDCGERSAVRSDHLIEGRVVSCGCYGDEKARVHGHTWADGYSATYSTWHSMLQRCQNPNNRAWEYYGGRGIKVCERWHIFENFLADMGERPADRSLDRFPDMNGNYEPGNCRWATQLQQVHNRRPRRTKAQIARDRAEPCL